ncbi:unnamed protein product [Spirodela intermedia]|uniref:Uncharacterized protein n=1 Tax=Spirodela intermedia TaxID=51605 RepID=A0A7I8JB05_SPIIN|nr:unnamed protein product [Spirodela intermedia]CAA6667398.1 unnamed protein product [Spirodela intermedia]
MAGEGEQLCEAAMAGGDCAKLRELIAGGADVCHFDGDGMTPLMYASRRGNAEAVRLLLEAGAPWNALTPGGLSAGDFAMENGHQEAFDLLLNAGIQAELVLGTVARRSGSGGSEEKYLEERVLFSEDRVMDSESACPSDLWGSDGGHFLNIGFGMGLVDSAIQRYSPASHTIIEAHPDVYKRMIEILFGRWQDVLPQLESYDGIFFDTYGEYYEDQKQFHQQLPKLLKPGGIYSYFNGFCGGNAFFTCLGFSTQYVPLPVKDCLSEEIWDGVRHKYWQLDTYYLPVCQASCDSE